MSKDVKPCPFCGNEWPTITLNSYSATWEIRCSQCDIVFRLGAGEKARIRERIVERWNSRRQDNNRE